MHTTTRSGITLSLSINGGVEMHQWELLIVGYVGYLSAIGRPPTTIGLRGMQLRHIARLLGKQPSSVTRQDLLDVFAAQAWKPETRKSYRNGLRAFFGWAHAAGHIDTDPAALIPAIAVPRASAKPCREATYRRALANAAPREKLMMRLAAEAGLRRAEIAQVHTRDVRRTASGPSLLVHGKGSHERVVPINDGLAGLLEQASGWVFPSRKGGHLSVRTVGMNCSALLGEGATLHMLRHMFATNVYRNSRNLHAVQKLLGHSSLAITERYLECTEDELRAAMMAGLNAA